MHEAAPDCGPLRMLPAGGHVTIRKVNFEVFPELEPTFKFSLDNRYGRRKCRACRARPAILYTQDASEHEGPIFANTPTPPAYCWPCAASAQAVMARLAGSEG